MSEKSFIGYRNENIITCNFNDGKWEVVNQLVQKRSYDGKDWETKEVSFRSVQNSIERAYADTLLSMSYYLKNVDDSLFTKPESSNVENDMPDRFIVKKDTNIVQ